MGILRQGKYMVYFPRAGLIEVVSVLKRSGLTRDRIMEIVRAIEDTFIVIREARIYNKAIEVALLESPSGFDTYFIALTAITNSILITDDEPMKIHAERLGLNTMLIREVDVEEIHRKLSAR